MSEQDAVIRLVNEATKDWVKHTLGECDPETCVGTHDASWRRSRAKAISQGRVS